MSAENTVRVDGIIPTATGAMTIANTAMTPIYVTSGIPAGTQLYTTQIVDAPGVVAANNFLSIFNPLGSGKVFTFYQFVAFPYAGGATSATASMAVFRTTAASGGTLRPAADVGKFVTSQTNSVSEVRTGNPTTTNANVPILSVPPAITAAAAGVSAVASITPPTGASFICLPGEGVVARTAAGDTDQFWDLGFVWSEA